MLCNRALALAHCRWNSESHCLRCAVVCACSALWEKVRTKAHRLRHCRARLARRGVELVLRRRTVRGAASLATPAASTTVLAIHVAWRLHCHLPARRRRDAPGPGPSGDGSTRPQRIPRQRPVIAAPERHGHRTATGPRATNTTTVETRDHTIELQHRLTHFRRVALGAFTSGESGEPRAARLAPTCPRGPSPRLHRAGAVAQSVGVAVPVAGGTARYNPIALHARTTPAAAAAALSPLQQMRAHDLVWRNAAATPRGAAIAPAPLRAANTTPSSTSVERGGPAFTPSGSVSAAVRLDPASADRLADEVISRVERHLRIERERRGL